MQNEGTGKSSWWMLNPDAKAGTCKSSRRREPSMEGGVSSGSGALANSSSNPNGRSPGDFKKRGRSKKTASGAGGLFGGGQRNSKAGMTPGLYEIPDSPGKPRHLSGFPFTADLKGQPLPTPLYQDFSGGGRLSPRLAGGDNGFGPGGLSGPPSFTHAAAGQPQDTWAPPEYQTIVPDYFPGKIKLKSNLPDH